MHHLVRESLVMIRPADLPQLEWLLGKVARTFLDDPGFIQTVEVQMGNYHYLRPLEYIVPLKLSCEAQLQEKIIMRDL